MTEASWANARQRLLSPFKAVKAHSWAEAEFTDLMQLLTYTHVSPAEACQQFVLHGEHRG